MKRHIIERAQFWLGPRSPDAGPPGKGSCGTGVEKVYLPCEKCNIGAEKCRKAPLLDFYNFQLPGVWEFASCASFVKRTLSFVKWILFCSSICATVCRFLGGSGSMAALDSRPSSNLEESTLYVRQASTIQIRRGSKFGSSNRSRFARRVLARVWLVMLWWVTRLFVQWDFPCR